MIFGVFAAIAAGVVKLAGSVMSGIAATVKTCASVGAKAVSGALSKIGTTVQSVSTSLENFAKGPLTEFGKKVSEQAVSIYNRSLEIAESKDLGPIFGPFVADLKSKFINKTAHKVAEKLGIIEKGEKQEHVGCRVEEADKHANDWKQRETFNSFKNYYKYLKEKIPEVDEQKIEKNERYYQLLGMMVEQEAIQEELGIKLPEDFLMEVGRSKMEPEEYLAFADVSGKYGWEAVQGFLKNTLPVKDLDKIGGALLSALEQHCLGKSPEDLKIRLSHICAASNNDKALKTKIYREDLLKEYPGVMEEVEEKRKALEEEGLLPKWYGKNT